MPNSTTTKDVSLAEILSGTKGKVYTSSDLIALLGKVRVTSENARQILRRQAKDDGVWRSEKLKLANNERLFAATSTLETPDFIANVAEKVSHTKRKGLARCLSALSTRHVLHRLDVIRLLAVSPSTAANVGTRLYEAELEGLKELGIRIIHEGTALESLVSPAIPDLKESDQIATIAAERLRYSALIARVLADMLRKQNLLSWNKVEMPDTEVPYVTFNGQVFTAYGFSYVKPLVRWNQTENKSIPCPVLIDCYHDVCALAEVQAFAQRIQRATNRGRSKLPSLGVIAARDFPEDAWAFARKQGLVTVNLRQAFGEEALEAMVLIEKLLHGLEENDKAEAIENFKSFSSMMDDLKTNPIVVALRSIGFEALSALILRSQGYEQVELGRHVPFGDTTRDVDVFGILGDELRIIECKAYHRRKSVLEDDVTKFFTQTVPALKKWLRSRDIEFSKCKAELWTTGPLGNDARTALHKLKRAKSDEWSMTRAEDLKGEIPKSIRERSLELFRSIATAETTTDDDSQ